MFQPIPQFSCWRIAPGCYFVIASCAKTGLVDAVIVEGELPPRPYDRELPLPDVRMFYPVKWQALPAVPRAFIRDRLQRLIHEAYPGGLTLGFMTSWDACG